MSRRDILFYLAVLVALVMSAATLANINRLAQIEAEVGALEIRADLQDVRAEQMTSKLENAYDELVSGLLTEGTEVADQIKTMDEDAANQSAWTPAGEFRIYHYCPCEKCTGKKTSDRDYGITSTGSVATEGRTIAVDPNVIPFGSEVLINDVIYIAEDTGVRGKTIDIFINDHTQAAAMGTYLTAVSWR